MSIDKAGDVVGLVLGLAAVAGLVLGWRRKLGPWVRTRAQARRDHDVVLYGRPAIPANPVTGERGQDRVPALGDRLDGFGASISSLGDRIDQVLELARGIHHETHNNDGSSLKDSVDRVETGFGERLDHLDEALTQIVDRLRAGDQHFDQVATRLEQLERQVGTELATTTATLAHAAEASRTGLEVIRDAIRADPPPDLD